MRSSKLGARRDRRTPAKPPGLRSGSRQGTRGAGSSGAAGERAVGERAAVPEIERELQRWLDDGGDPVGGPARGAHEPSARHSSR